MKFESLLAINAAIEMGMNVLHGVGRQLAVDIRLGSFSVSLQSAISRNLQGCRQARGFRILI